MENDYRVIIDYVQKWDYTQSPITERKVTLMNHDEIVFKNLSVFVAHRRMYQMGLAKLAQRNLI